jgi:hypothetical protein
VFGNPAEPTADSGAFEVYRTGTFVTNDHSLGLQKEWYAPKQLDTCNFIIQCLKLFSFDGATHTGLAVGEAADWDIPASSGVDNLGGFDASAKLIYQVGSGFGCQDNTNRFAGVALLGTATNVPCLVDTSSTPYGAYTQSNATYLYPTNGFVASQLWSLMQTAGYSSLGSLEDQHSVITYFNNLTLNPDDTVYVYTVISSVRNGSSSDLVDNVLAARQWFGDHRSSICGQTGCCIGLAGNTDCDPDDIVDIGDLTRLIDYLYISNDPLCCYEEGNADGDPGGVVDIGDLTDMIDYLYISNDPPKPCQ